MREVVSLEVEWCQHHTTSCYHARALFSALFEGLQKTVLLLLCESLFAQAITFPLVC